MLDTNERDRRYRLVRQKMAEQSLDAMIVIGNAQIDQKGFLKYLTNYRNTLYNVVAIVPAEGEPRLLVPSPVQKFWAERLSWISKVEEETPSLSDALVRSIREMGLSKAAVGLASAKIMPAETYNDLIHALPDMTLTEASSIIEELRMVKSIGEQKLARGSARLADLSFEVLAEILKPGITERGVIAEVDRRLVAEGAQDIFHLISSERGDLMPFMPTDRVIQDGDAVIFNTELSGPGGYWIQMVRTAFVGKPAADTEKMYNTLIEIVNQLPDKLIPGAKSSEIANWVRNQTIEAGYETGVHFGHCLGLDVVERPMVSVKEEAVLQTGMIITVHPQLVAPDKSTTVWYADTYLITEGRAEALTTVDPMTLKNLG